MRYKELLNKPVLTAPSSKADDKSFFHPVILQNEPQEKQADTLANSVMQNNNDSLNLKQKINRKEASSDTVSSQTVNHIGSLNGNGRSLPKDQKSFFERKFGHDFSGVRIHTDAQANQSAKSLDALAYTTGNDIVFGNQYKPETEEGKKLLAHELTHVVQQAGNVSRQIQAKRELDAVTEKELLTKCQARIGEVITKLEDNAKKTGMPDDIKEAVTLLRKKYTENKIKCYYLDGRAGGETNFTTGEIYMDAKLLEGTTDVFANIGEGNVLHEGTHALHNQKFPVSTKKYGKELDDKKAGKTSTLSDAEQKDLQKLDAYTEYWAYRKMQEYNNIKNNSGKNDDTIHSDTLKDMRSRGGILPLNVVWAFDKDFDPRKWKPKN